MFARLAVIMVSVLLCMQLWCRMGLVVPNRDTCLLQDEVAGEHASKGWQVFWNLQWKKLCRSEMTVFV